ncbi:hypothetical protein FSHL1_005578 [Fusarium sambucinum]
MECPAQLLHARMIRFSGLFLELYIKSMFQTSYPDVARFLSQRAYALTCPIPTFVPFYGLRTKHLTVLDIEVYNDHPYHLQALVPFWTLFSHLTALKIAILRFHAVCDAMPPVSYAKTLFCEDAYEIPIGLFKDLAANHTRLKEGDLTGFPYEIDDEPWKFLKSKIDIVPTDSDGEYLTPTSVRRLALVFIDSRTKIRPKILSEAMLQDLNGNASREEIYQYHKKLWLRASTIENEEPTFEKIKRFFQNCGSISPSVNDSDGNTSGYSQGARRSCWNQVRRKLLLCYFGSDAEFGRNEH